MVTLLYQIAETLNRQSPEIDYMGERFFLEPEVYRPLHGEESVLRHLRPEDAVLDLGCGSGILTVLMARTVARVVATDVSGPAVACTRKNLAGKGLESVEVLHGDMFASVTGKFDKIIANPPWLFFFSPSSDERAWGTSRTYLPTLFKEARAYLVDSPDARILAFFPLQFSDVIEKAARAEGFSLVGVHPHGDRASLAMRLQ
ncbi:MAG: methyltransferase, partial [Candidatus Sericytochromatia bacterium]